MSDRATTTASLTFESLYGTLTLVEKLADAQTPVCFDADDIAQDTFLRVMVSETLSTIRDPRSFLCTIAKRVMVDLFRRNALEKAYLEMLALMPEGERLHLRNAKANSRPYNSSTACWTG
ncbi:RNA polymerase sigma factor [Escherichia coli]|uniref:RNA polymerase sigma factor n=1 Tax=Escherichia coli TaxID=562 RepID=A0A376U3A9_ECOLX|nr:RNA polymerase sigma factor [Escherichia coli]